MDVKLQGDMYFLSGKLDEHTDFTALGKATSSLKINLRDITSINSNGIRKFLAFVLDRSSLDMELHECTTEFISNVNVIPQLLGQPPMPQRIKSLYMPLSCEDCDRSENFLITLNDIKASSDGTWAMRPVGCKSCKNPMTFDVEPADYFIFMEDAA